MTVPDLGDAGVEPKFVLREPHLRPTDDLCKWVLEFLERTADDIRTHGITNFDGLNWGTWAEGLSGRYRYQLDLLIDHGEEAVSGGLQLAETPRPQSPGQSTPKPR